MADHLNPPDDNTEEQLQPSRRDFLGLTIAAGSGAMLWPIFSPLIAQEKGVFCVAITGKDLVNPGEIVSSNGVLKGLIDLVVDKRSITYYQGNGGYVCFQPTLRAYQGYKGWNVDPKNRVTSLGISGPGPTLRAAVGDKIQLIFLNRIDKSKFQATSVTSGDIKSVPNKCDTVFNQAGQEVYPKNDKWPNCFHASNTSNLHFHGTHVSPGGFADNVLVGVIPMPNMDPAAQIEKARNAYALMDAGEDPTPFLIADAMNTLKVMLAAAKAAKDATTVAALEDAIHTNETNIEAGEWPQYWPGLYPQYFTLPKWSGSMSKFPMMGQSPGTHWYHCHQHGSTTLQIINGMAGLFLITGDYDDQLLKLGGGTAEKPKIKEKVMIFQLFGEQPQQIQASPSTNTIAVNGQVMPKVSMNKGEVQWWRIGDAAMKAHGVGDFLFLDEATYQKFAKNPASLQYINPDNPNDPYNKTMIAPPAVDKSLVPNLYQTAQDGVQFAWENYERNSAMTQVQLAPGNRADFLVKAPATNQTSYLVFWFSEKGPPAPPDIQTITVLKVVTAGDAGADVNTSLPTKENFPKQPEFLTDITDAELEGRKRTVTFSMQGGIGRQPVFKIDGEQFDENEIDQLMLLGTAEEWTLINISGRSVMHPFHIHINPFQVTEVFDPATMTEPLKLPQPWIWWDTIPIPAGVQKVDANGKFMFDKDNYPVLEGPPGHIKIRSRFVDFPGNYVLHCHILGHEDRGMMQLVKVLDNKTVIKHH